MSEFKVEVVSIRIKDHPDADRLEVAQIGEYQSIIRKDQYEDGDLVAYIPEGSVVPDPILEEMGLKGKLAGSQGNRVKAVRLRGVLSQGLCYPTRDEWEEGQDVTEELGVEKYVPPIPVNMGGEVYALGPQYTLNYDIENLKRYPEVLEEGEEVVMTEKIHGTNFCCGVIDPQHSDPEHGPIITHSKGLGSKGLVFKPNAENNEHNVYLKAARRNDLPEKLAQAYKNWGGKPIFVLGEVYGVQDLKYGANTSCDVVGFAAFDVHIGYQSDGRYLDPDEFFEFCALWKIPTVPILYQGPFTPEVVAEHTDGPEQVSGEELHIREGLVIKPVKERQDMVLGRVALKSVSDDYLTRGDDDGDEENEVTEYT